MRIRTPSPGYVEVTKKVQQDAVDRLGYIFEEAPGDQVDDDE